MNLIQLNDIGIGAIFPIQLTTPKDEDGNPEYTTIMVNGVPTRVLKVGWYPATGLDLIKNNLTSVFVYQIGERYRQENFGSRLWECIEEQNTQLLQYMVATFIKEAIATWEARVNNLKVESTREDSKLYLRVTFSVNTSMTESIILEYDKITNTSYAY